MKIHHLNCGTMCPMGRSLVCHCLVLETPAGLILVDTGLGLNDVREPKARLSPFFQRFLRLELSPEETAARQIERLGYRVGDVRHIVLTHLDFDHAGGLEDFPRATVHVYQRELDAARAGDRSQSAIASGRYRHRQWEGVNWRTYHVDGGDSWQGFDCVRELEGVPSEVVMVPLIGHTWGHCGVAVYDGTGWLLHAGDAYFHHRELDADRRHCPPLLRFYQVMMEVDRGARLRNQERLRQLAHHGDSVRIISAHDVTELEREQQGQPLLRRTA